MPREFSAAERERFGVVAEQCALALQNATLHEELELLAVTDRMTGMYNHVYGVQRLDEEVKRAQRFGHQLSLVMLDIDDFKSFNDTYGHPAGDELLAAVGGVIKRALRDMDIAVRYGGEEFAVILPETPTAGAALVAERIRSDIEELRPSTRVRMARCDGRSRSALPSIPRMRPPVAHWWKRRTKRCIVRREQGRTGSSRPSCRSVGPTRAECLRVSLRNALAALPDDRATRAAVTEVLAYVSRNSNEVDASRVVSGHRREPANGRRGPRRAGRRGRARLLRRPAPLPLPRRHGERPRGLEIPQVPQFA